MKIVETFADVRAARRGFVALVPTMGYLHEGHLALLRDARAFADYVVMSLFVNPLQFNEEADLSAYPRDFDRDAALAEQVGVDLLFAPSLEEMYPELPATRVSVEALTTSMEGIHRPGHFEGVATVVAKLFAGLQPDRAYFGRKDAQQLAVVARLVHDLSFPVEITSVPTVREADGLALSSRNVFLDDADRRVAVELSRSLFAAADLVEAGERDGAMLEEAVVDRLRGVDGLHLEYAELADADDVVRLSRLDRTAFLAAAAKVGGTRLIDNVRFLWHEGNVAVDRGQRLEAASMLYDSAGGG